MVHDPFWAEQPSILWNKNRLSEFFPAPNMTWSEMLNSLVRGAFYISFLLAFYYKSDAPFYFILFVCLFTFIVARYPGPVMVQLSKAQSWLSQLPKNLNRETDTDKKTIQESFVLTSNNTEEWKQSSIQPTDDNPFMNFNIFTDPTTKVASPLSYGSPSLQKDIESKFQTDLYRDVSDIYNKQHNQREFYTTPCTTFPNDQTSFARWLYAVPPTCKEEGIRCIPYDNNPVNPISTSAESRFYPTPTVPTVHTQPS